MRSRSMIAPMLLVLAGGCDSNGGASVQMGRGGTTAGQQEQNRANHRSSAQ
jgi:hypothetical protein